MTVYVILLCATLTLAFVLGMMQCFLWEQLVAAQGEGARDWLLQVISAFVAAGTVGMYFISGPLAAAFRKRYVMCVAACLSALVFFVGASLHWWPSPWLYLFVLGMLLGSFNAGKMASAPLVADLTGMSVTATNAGMSVVFLIGVLSGFPAGSALEHRFPAQGHILPVCLLALAGVFGFFCRYRNEVPRRFIDEERNIIHDTGFLFRHHWLFLAAGPLLWGVANAAQLAAMAMAVRDNMATKAVASMIPLWAVVGSVLGTIVSPFFHKKRYETAVVCAFIMSMALPFFPRVNVSSALLPFFSHVTVSYALLAGSFVVLGIFFGIATNLIDAAYLEAVGKERKEGQGAALQSAMISFSMTAASGTIGIAVRRDWIEPNTQFALLAAFGMLAVVLAMVISFRHGRLVAWGLDLFGHLLRRLLSLRYRIALVGGDRIAVDKGVLILPNHPAEIDPVILETLLWRKLRPRPVVLEDFFVSGPLRALFGLIRALPMPNMELGRGTFKIRRIERSLDDVVAGLAAGDNILIYPSGGLQRTDLPTIGGASAVHAILQKAPGTPILLVRTRGLWGSSFSWAARNGRPGLGGCFLHGALVLLANALFFTPRRAVEVTVEPAPEAFPRQAGRTEINQWLDAWYNAAGPTPPVAKRYYRWSRKRPKLASLQPRAVADIGDVPASVQQGVREELARMRKCKPEEILPAMDLRKELGFDSLEMTEVFFWLDARFGVADATLTDLSTVGALMQLAHGRGHAGEMPVTPAPRAWSAEGRRPALVLPHAATVHDAFLDVCSRMGSSVACADDMAGVLTFSRLKLAALALSRAVYALPGRHVGIMLPASVGATVAFFATLLAGKVPVMVNWTLGARNIRHVIDLSGIKAILTSSAFVENADSVPYDEVEPLLVFLEDIRRTQLGWRVKLAAMVESLRSPNRLLALRGLDSTAASDTAVILFTSGSESVPKGVPLSHQNILADINAALAAISLNADDVVLSFLPPFHSFGLTATMLMPIVTGLRMACYPNPTEARRIAHATRKWRATIVAGTPAFLKGVFKAARPGQLASVRLFVSGAEKAPEDLFALATHMGSGSCLLEGYGITECSPVVSLCRPNEQPVGVGKPLDGVELLIVAPDSRTPVPNGERGLILVRGANVFAGYLGPNAPNPFIEVNGAHWYVTGDLGYIAPDGSLVIAGRLKRFIKIGGEMVSLPALEEALIQKWPQEGDAPTLAVAALEVAGGRPHLAVFTTMSLSVDDVNTALRAAGFSPLVRASSVQTIPALPLLGTGKTDYRSLNEQLAAKLVST